MSHFAHFLNPAPVGTVRVLLYASCDVLLLYAIRDRCDVSQAIVGCRVPNLKWVTKLEFVISFELGGGGPPDSINSQPSVLRR